MARTDSQRRSRVTIVILALLFFVLPLLTSAAVFYTDYLWFDDLGQTDVFATTLMSQAVTGLAFAVLTFLMIFVNARIARRMSPRAVLTSVGDMPPQFEEAILRLRANVGPFVDRIILWGSVVIAAAIGFGMSPQWETIRLALAATPFGVTDPQFGRDVAYYVFTLPALRLVADWLPSIIVLATVIAMFIHLVDGAIQPWARLKGFAPHVKAHLSVLLGFLIASKAFDYYLDVYELTLSPRGQVTGASYTDVKAQLPALQILIAIAIASAIVLLVNIRVKGWQLPAISLGVWVAASILVGSVYPALVQQFRVAPNEVAAEAPYIERNISSTRRAFGLDDIETRAFPAGENLTAQDVLDNADTLENVRLWDPSIVGQSYQQLQSIRPYYEFSDVDIDRYTIDGQRRQVLVSVRELNVNQLADRAQTWVNQHLVYTHGYGLVMSPVSETDSRGLPNFIIRDVPPESDTDLLVDQSAIYFGESTRDYIVVNTDTEEFDYPVGDQFAKAEYAGVSGIDVGGVARRASFALRFGSAKLLLSEAIKNDSRVLFDRDISTRLDKLAPWLWFDGDPYPVVADGRVVWVADAYTWSDSYPYAEPFGGVSYVRNSVKVTIDAYDGTTTLYAFDAEDPILETWREIFPDLVKDASEIPDSIREHFRYPEGLFRIQAEVYKNYHMTDAQVFYNKEDSWELPGERDGKPMDPYYVLMRLPGDSAESFQMIMPFTPRNKDNMIGWMSAKSDPEDYGRRVVYTFPKARVILGPEQISARINQDETISPQLTLWSQRGSQAVFGNMLVVPLEESVVYIQPLYLQAEQTAIPQLTRVLVVYADKVVMERDLETALLKVFGETVPASEDSGADPVDLVGADAAAARDLYERALEAQKAGDWAQYGELIEQLGGILNELAGPLPDVSIESTSAAE